MSVTPHPEEFRDPFRVDTPIVFFGLFLLCTLPLLLSRIQDVDIWWHMHYGREFLKDFSFPDFAAYYFTETNSKIEYLRYNFLGDVLFYGVYSLGGDAGLQIFKILVVSSSLWLLLSCAKDRYTWLTLFLSIAFVFATYQKQLIRNSMFGLLGMVLVLWIFNRYRFNTKKHYIWFLPVVIGFWGTMHGSYLLGLGLVTLLFIGDWLDGWRNIHSISLKSVAASILVLIACYGVSTIANPVTGKYVDRIINRITLQDTLQQEDPEQPSIHLAEKDPSPFTKVKYLLNNTVFRIPPGVYKSADFVSPFDRLGQIFVPVSLGFAVLGSVLLTFFIRPVRLSFVLAFGGMTLLGLGYLRTVGYLPVIALFVCFTAAGAAELRIPPMLKRIRFRKWTGPASCLIWVVFIWTALVAGYLVSFSGISSHIFGFGRLPMFDDAMGDHVLQQHADNEVFTPIDTGGYYLFTWYPEKKVFMAGLFSAHPENLFADYKRVMHEGEIDLIYEKYEISVAVIPHHKTEVKNRFFSHEDWAVAAISTGNILFVRQKGVPVRMDIAVLMEPQSLAFSNDKIKKTIATSMYAVLTERINLGQSREAARLVANNEKVFSLLRQSAPGLFAPLDQYL